MTAFEFAGIPIDPDKAREAPDETLVFESETGLPVVRCRPARMCLCSHPRSAHYTDRKGRPTCGHFPCGCLSFREKAQP